MSRSAAERFPRRRLSALAVAAALALAPGADRLGAQTEVQQETGVELSSAVRLSLQRLQEQWLLWVTAFYQDRPDAADATVKELQAIGQSLGFERLPDFAQAMVARASEPFAVGGLERATRALDAAEELDAGRPDVAFTRAWLARRGGQWFAAASWYLRGVARAWRLDPDRQLLAAGAGFWVVVVVFFTAALWVLLQVAVKGSAVYADLHRLFSRRLPGTLSHLACVVALVWPVLLPAGPVWLLLYWSALAWGYGSRSERLVQIVLWVLVAVLPVWIAAQQVSIAIALSPPWRALENVREKRLYGALFSDLGVLRSVLPESVPVKQVIADLHRGLGQWDYARSLYHQILEVEPDNAPAAIDLGAYFFRKGDFAAANQFFQKAATISAFAPAAYYNLSQSFSDAYLFEESKQALAKARQLDDRALTAWLQRETPERVLLFDGGLARRSEIRSALQAAWGGGVARPSWLTPDRRLLSLPVLLLVGLGAFAWDRGRRRLGSTEPTPWLGEGSGLGSRLVRLLVPAVLSAQEGRGWLAVGSLGCSLALLLLPLAGHLALRLPWGHEAGRTLLWVIAAVGWLGLLAWRWRRLVKRT